MAAVRFSLPAQLLEPTPNLGMAPITSAQTKGCHVRYLDKLLTQYRILELLG